MTKSYLPQEIIRKKRDGGVLDADEIEFFVGGMTAGTISDAQIGAFAMAVLWRGMSRDERVVLTRAMTGSGRVLDWSDLPGPALDKHSTGGIGDKISLVLAPLVAACGGYVPMISGRGLGHTGGTVDKMEAIPGYQCMPETALFRRVVRDVGAAIIGQTPDLAPADRRLYAIRDITATVESVPLITGSILSKKLAAGLAGLVMDVKFGSGAFMAEFDRAAELADAIVDTAVCAGLPTSALLTDMNQPLGHCAGNALEVREAIEFLTGKRREARLAEVTLALSAELLVLGRIAVDTAAARVLLDRALATGAAAERFQRMVHGLGGPADLVERPDRRLAWAVVERPAPPVRAGLVAAVDTRAVGLAIMALGGGRRLVEDRIDHTVGLVEFAPIGAAVGPDRPLAIVHAHSEGDAEVAMAALQQAYRIADAAEVAPPIVRDRRGVG
ncbi:MAG: thymidine phosphorylase [Alphaproteobacteria bacterium]|nr:thymidine phosphorylase [Alphaproteobacteria bacterium]